jgi:fructose-1-phosphate kinase PfkB-like protein
MATVKNNNKMENNIKEFWMVFVEGSYPPQAKHDTYESANKEAERLVIKTGKNTAVLKVVTIYAPKPAYDIINL